jgi:5-hydroxyisourate hydrolase-like protein (transthyretin family)
MGKNTKKTYTLNFAKTKQDGKCVELLLTAKEIEAGKKRALDFNNNKWIDNAERCHIIPTPKVTIELPVQLSIWERFQKIIGF